MIANTASKKPPMFKDVRALGGLGGAGGLHVEADEAGARIAGTEFLPRLHRRGAVASAVTIDPRHVVGDEDYEISARALADHVPRVCRTSATLSEAGRRLFAITRAKRKVANDADRLLKYLTRFGLKWSACSLKDGSIPPSSAVSF